MGTQQQGWLTVAIYLGSIILVVYIFIILPRKKQEKKHNELVDSLKRGDKVVTIGGMRGEITKVKEDAFLIRTGENTELEFIKSAVAYKVEKN